MKRLGKALVALTTATALGAAGFAGASTAMAAGTGRIDIKNVEIGDEYKGYKLLNATVADPTACQQTGDGILKPTNTALGATTTVDGKEVNSCKVSYTLLETDMNGGYLKSLKDAIEKVETEEKTDPKTTLNSADAILKWLTGAPNDSTGKLNSNNIDIFAKEFTKNYTNAAFTKTAVAEGTTSGPNDVVVGANKTMSITGLDTAYYLVQQTVDGTAAAGTSNASRTMSRNMVMTVIDGQVTTVINKGDTTTLTKAMTNNKSQDENGDGKVASYGIGDHIKYEVTATLPKNYNDFGNFYLKFDDKLSKGLTFRWIDFVTVNRGSGDAATKYELKYTTTPEASWTEDAPNNVVKATMGEKVDGTTPLTMDLGDLTTYTTAYEFYQPTGDQTGQEGKYGTSINGFKFQPGDVVTVQYDAMINAESAQLLNTNEVVLTYSESPNTTTRTKTPIQKTTAITFDLKTNKVDAQNNALENAQFSLTRIDNDGNSTNTDHVKWEKVDAGKGDKKNQAIFEGLSTGLYKLEETKTPVGYNTIKPQYIYITESHDNKTSIDTDVDLTLTVKMGDGYSIQNGAVILTNSKEITSEAISLNLDNNTGSVSIDIVNVAGSQLPSTGGMGTTILYIVGGLIVLAAAGGLTMAVRKRNN